MAEYIERDRLIEDLTELAKYQTGERQQGILGVIETIRIRKAADVEPVRYAHWNYCCPIDGNSYRYCSKCLSAVYDSVLYVSKNYCPNCGADMRGSNDE